MASNFSISPVSVPETRPSDLRRTVVSEYVAWRLTLEKGEQGRGYIAKIAKAIRFSGPAMSTAARGKPVGEDMASALAKYWKLGGYEELVEAAVTWKKTQDSKPAVVSRLSDRGPQIPTSPFAIGAGAAMLDGATRGDVATAKDAVAELGAPVTWRDAYGFVMEAMRDRIAPITLPPVPARIAKAHDALDGLTDGLPASRAKRSSEIP